MLGMDSIRAMKSSAENVLTVSFKKRTQLEKISRFQNTISKKTQIASLFPPFPCCSVNHECSLKKTQTEKKNYSRSPKAALNDVFLPYYLTKKLYFASCTRRLL